MSDGHAEGTIIAIQCPSCKTKFGVDAGVLGQVARPRFHCSKCDTTFSKSLASIMAALSKVSRESSGGTRPRPEPRGAAVSSSHLGGVEHSASLTPTSPELGQSPARTTTNRVSSQGATDYSASFDESTQLFSSSRTETDRAELSERSGPLEGKRKMYAPSVEDSGTMISRLTSSMQRAAVEETIFSRLKSPAPVAADSQASPHVVFSPETSPSASTQNHQKGWLHRWLNPQSALHRVLFALLPFISFQLLIGIITLQVVSNPRSLHVVHKDLVSSATRVPPPEIQLINVGFRKQPLDNGESVYVVSGQVANRTGQPFSQIQVQGITFDDLGRPLQKAVGAAGSSLTIGRLSSFSAATISDQQQGSLRKDVRVGPQSETDFLVVLAPRAKRPSFFSARVFAVGSRG